MQKFPGIPVGNFMMANSREFPVALLTTRGRTSAIVPKLFGTPTYAETD